MNYMQEETPSTKRKAPEDLEATTQRVSLSVSVVGLGLMLAGLVDMLIVGASFPLAGGSVLPLLKLLNPSQVPTSLVAMSTGIVLLALLPAIRVLLALWLYLRRHSILNTLVALIVLMELLLSMRVGG
jgi:uncharacterized membrane protein